MAKARALDKRRKSIKNIRKITRTMELVSTAQFRRAMDRAVAADSYTKRMVHLVSDLAKTGLDVSHPLLEERSEPKNATMLVLTANRGMCGGYNSSILRLALQRYQELNDLIPNINIDVSGKRGISYMKYRKIDIDQSFDQFDHKPAFDEINEMAQRYLDAYLAGEIDRLEVAYCKFISMSKQYPVVETLLPMTEMKSDADDDSSKPGGEKTNVEYEFLPSPQSILEEVVPNAFKVKLFKCFLDAAVSEQIARMIAMKSATENADSMITTLTSTYNRARQSQITNEMLEVISGANALN
ncbi:MAG: ATP synthase F1 subunit gamma [Planctomycetia bacterium]|nr:ATP synthase F1 subunit gamma [Planctomycetia bacterium]